jgi:N-acetylglucosamine-6-phosphate deacetylase
MTRLLIHGAQLMTADGVIPEGWLLIEEGRITALGEGQPSRATRAERLDGHARDGWIALPGFIDLHVHGGAGCDTMDATPEALGTMARFYAACGVTGFLATTVTAPGPETLRALENVVACTGAIGPESGGATLLGAHLEGPYLNANMRGAQDGQYIRRADPEEYRPWLALNVIRHVTVAPEFPENHAFMADCVAQGVNVGIGHTQATYEEALAAVERGARQVTHTFNAMTGLHHRRPGMAGAALALDALVCEVIADNIHLHPAILRLIARAKGPGGVVLITDAIQGAGMPEGVYDLGGQEVTVAGNTAKLADGTLAGSVLTMDAALRNMLAADLPLDMVWPMTSATPAAQIGLGDHKGWLHPGYDGDVVLLDADFRVQATIVGGHIVYQAAPGA